MWLMLLASALGGLAAADIPGVPTGLWLVSRSDASLTVEWSLATDASGTAAASYQVHLNGVLAKTVTVPNAVLSGLASGTNYAVTVKALNAQGGASASSAPLNATTMQDSTPPSIPIGLAATSTDHAVTLTWQAASDAVGVAGYDVLRAGVLVGRATTTSFTDGGLPSSTTFTYTAQAFDAAGNRSAPSVGVQASTRSDTTPPSVPTGLRVTGQTALSVSLAWNASTDDNVQISSYRISWGTRTLNVFDATTTVVTDLIPGTAYSFTVDAQDRVGNRSAASAAVTGTTAADTVAPSVPGVPRADEVSLTSISLSWAASSDNAGVAGYELHRNGIKVATIGAYAYQGRISAYQGSLTSQTSYTFAVKAVDFAGNLSSASPTLTVSTVGDSQAPTPPGKLRANSISDTGFTLAWYVSDDGDGVGMDGYEVWLDGVKAQSLIGTVATVTGLAPARTYTVVVKAKDKLGNTSSSAPLQVSTLQERVSPTVPAGLKVASVTAKSATLSWSAASDNVAVIGYELLRGSVVVRQTTGLSVVDDGLSANTSYNYAVRAYDASGNRSAASAVVAARTSADTQAPTAPTALTVTGRSESHISLSWTAASDNVQVVRYVVLRGANEVGQSTGTSFTDSGLEANTAYTYTVKAVDGGGNRSPASTAVVATTLVDTIAPTIPSRPYASTVTTTSVLLGWVPSSDNVRVSTYELYRNGVLLGQAASNGYSDTGLTPGATVVYAVKARDLAGNVSALGDSLSITLPTDAQAPAAPTNLILSRRGDTSVDVTWNGSSDVGSRVVSYEVRSGTTVVATTTASWTTVAALRPATAYTYTVRAVDAAGNRSPDSLSLAFKTNTDSTAPSVPTGLTAGTPGLQSVPLNWAAASDGTAVTGYEISRDSVAIARVGAVTTFTDATVRPGTAFNYAVRAFDGAGNMSAYSAALRVTTPADTVAPTAPGSLTVTDRQVSRVNLSWTASSDAVGVARYQVLRNGSQVGLSTGTTYSDTGLSANATYTYTVRAIDLGNNQSPLSNAVTATTLVDTIAPGVPGKPIASSITSISLTISWAPPSDNVAVSGYEIHRNGTLLTQVTSNQYTNSGLTPGSTVTYAIKARDASGNLSAASASLSVTLPGDAVPPSVPAELTLSSRADTSLQLRWNASTDVGSQVVSYEVLSGTTVIATVTSTTATISGLLAGTTYTYTVRAVDVAGNRSAASLPLAIRTNTDSTAPSAPTLTAGTTGLQTVPLSWIAVTDNVAVTGYEISRNSVAIARVGTVISYTDAAVLPGISYTYRVRAFDGSGNMSPWSAAVSATTLADTVAPTIPGTPAVTGRTMSTVSLSWSAATDNVAIAKYAVLRNGTQVGFANGTTYTDSGLTANAAVSYSVKAVDVGNNQSAASAVVSTTTMPDSSAPSVPGMPSASNVQSTSLTLGWPPASDNLAVTAYEVYRNGALATTVLSNVFSDTGLTPGAAVTYAIKARDGAGNVSALGAALALTLPADVQPPIAPAELALSSRGDTTVSLTWVASTDIGSRVVSYEVLSGTTVVATTASVPTTVTGLLAGTSYTFTVRAVDAAGNRSPASLPLALRTNTDSTAPTVPGTLTPGTLGLQSVPLTWTAATDNVGVVGYEIARDWVSIARVGTVTSFTDTQVKPGVGYYYYVRAMDAAGNMSAWCPYIRVNVPADTVAPSVPTALTVSGRTAGTVSLSWTASSDNVGVARYLVLRNGSTVGQPTGTTFIDSGLSAATTYSYTVKAVDLGNVQSAATTAVSATTLADTIAPTVPGKPSASAILATSLTLSWPPSTDEVGVSAYQVHRNGVLVASPATNSFADTGLSPGVTVTYAIRARDGAGNLSALGAALTLTLPGDTTKPTAPTNLALTTRNDTSLTLQWSASSDIGSSVVSYEVLAGTTVLATSPSTSVTAVNLAAGTAYTLTVRAVDAAGNRSDASLPLAVRTQTDTTKPTAPTGLTAGTPGLQSVALTWTAASDNVAVAGYEIARQSIGVGRVGAVTGYTDTGVEPGKAYYYAVRAIDAAGNVSPWSASLLVSFPADTQSPAAPAAPVVNSRTAREVTLGWAAASDNVQVARYLVLRNGSQVASVTGTSYVDGGLPANTTFTYTLKAVDGANNQSAVSASTSTSTLADATAPVMTGAPYVTALAYTTVSMAWPAANDDGLIASYEILRDGVVIGATPYLSYNDSGLVPGTTVVYTIKAKDASGRLSAVGPSLAVTTPTDAIAPSAPAPLSLSSSITGSSVPLTWGAAADPESGIVGYDVYANGTKVASTTARNLMVTGMALATPHTFTVRARDAAGNQSMPSDALVVTLGTGDVTAPVAPTALVASNLSPGSVRLSWTAPAGETGVLAYEVYRASVFIGRTSSGTSFDDTLAMPGVASSYVVYARDAAGNRSAASTALSVTTPSDSTLPAVPTGLALAVINGSTVRLSWTAASDNVRVVGYQVYRDGAPAIQAAGPIANDTWRDSGRQYSYAVAALDQSGNRSALSPAVTITMPVDTTPPTVPGTPVATTVTTTSVTLVWTPSSELFSNQITYEILRGGVAIGTTTATSFNDTARVPASTAAYAVRARDRAGNTSAASATVNVATPGDAKPPTAPTGLYLVSRTGTALTLGWSGSSDAESAVAGYELLRGTTVVATITGTLVSGQVGSLSAGTAYTFTVRAFDVAGNRSASSLPLTAMTGTDATAPAVPAGLTAGTTTETTIALSWSLATDDTAVVAYEIARANVVVGRVTGTAFTDANLVPGTSRTYQVRALDASGNASAWSAGLSVSTRPDTVAPSAPTNLVVTGTAENRVSLSWSTATDNLGIGRYLVRRNGQQVGETTGTTFTDTTVNAAATYTYTVVAEDIARNLSPASAAVTATTGADGVAPTVPGQPYPTTSGFTSVALAWAASSDNVRVTGYELLRNGVLVTTTTQTSYSITGLAPGVASTYTVRARDAAGNVSAASPAATVSTLSDTMAPAVPTALSLSSRSDTSLTLSWAASTDPESGITGYEVLRGTTVVLTATSTSGVVPGLAAATSYVFTVRAFDAAGNRSAASLPLTVMTGTDAVAPTAPTGLTATSVTMTSVALSWTAASDNAAVASYEVRRETVSVARVTGTTVVDSGLRPGTAFRYWVRAVDPSGNASPWTPVLSVTTQPDAIAPSAPAGLTVTSVSESRVALSWTAASDNLAVARYIIRRNGSDIGNATGTTFADTTVSAATTYAYTVLAEDAAGNRSTAPTAVSATTGADTQAPSAPGQPYATASSHTSIALAWAASSDNVRVASYEVYRNGAAVATSTSTSVSLTGLATGTTSTWTVKARDAAGNLSLASVGASIATAADTVPPTAPTALVLQTRNDTSLPLVWSGASDAESGLAGYELLRGTTVVATVTQSYNSATATGLTAATAYTFTVRAFDAAGNRSPSSLPLTVVTGTDATAPSTPTGLVAGSVTMTGLTLGWTAASDNVAVAKYEVDRDTRSIALTTTTTFTDTALRPGTAFRYRIRAVDPSGNASPWSTVLNATTVVDTVVPSVPTALAVSSVSESRVSLTWTASSDNVAVGRYLILRAGQQVGESSGTTFSDTTVTAATAFSYTVVAEDLAGNRSAASAAVSVTTGADTLAPSVPGQPYATSVGYTTAALTWAASSDNVRVTAYEIFRNGVLAGTTVGTSFTLASLVPGSSSTFTVKARDAVGNRSVASPGTVIAMPADAKPPEAPTGLTLGSRADASLTLNWTAGAEGESGIAGFEILRGTTVAATVASTSGTVTGLAPTTAYVFTVRAFDAAGNRSPASLPLTAITAVDSSAPTVPTGVVTGTVTESSVALTWAAANDNVAVTFYEIARGGTVVGRATARAFTDLGLRPGVAQGFQLRAWDAAGNVSAWMANHAVTTLPDSTRPSAPTGLTASPQAPDRVLLSWVAASDNIAVARYLVKRTRAGSTAETLVGEPTGTTITAADLVPNTTYRFHVYAIDTAGNHSLSAATVDVTTAGDTTPPSVPGTPVITSRGPSTIALAWMPSTDGVLVATYEVFRNGVKVLTVFPSGYQREPSPQGADLLLAPSTSYLYAVRAVDNSGNASALSPTVSGTTTADTLPPAAPTNLTLVGRTSRSLTVSWTASSDATGGSGVAAYDIRIAGVVRASVPADTTSGTVAGLTPATSYAVTVTARDRGGLSSVPSLPLAAITEPDTSDFQPSGLTVTDIGMTGATLVWTPSPVGSVTGYEILWEKSGTIFSAVVVGTTPAGTPRYVLTGLTPSTTYFYVVRSLDAAGNRSNPTSAVMVSTLADTVPPSTPAGLTVTGKTATSVSLAWAAASDNYRMSFYRIYATAAAASGGYHEGEGTTATVTGLKPSTTYACTVTAVDMYGNASGASAAINVTTNADTTAPSAPKRLRASHIGSASVTLEWDNSSDNVEVTAYDIYRGGILIGTSTYWPWRDATPAAATTYTYTVKARDAAGLVSAASNALTVTTKSDLLPPSAPTNLVATGKTDSSITLGWNAASDDDDGTGVVNYEIAKAGVVVATVASTSGTVGTLVPLTSYVFTVRAVDRSGNRSAWSVPLTTATTEDRTPPSVPTQVVAGTPTRTGVAISWAASSDNIGVTGYEVVRDGQRVVATLAGRLFTDSGLVPGTTYSYAVRAFDAIGNRSADSAVVTITTAADATPPTVPANFRVVSTTRSQVVLAWDAASDAGSSVAGYLLRRQSATVSDEVLFGPTVALTWTDAGLPADSAFLYAVAAVDRAGLRSGWSVAKLATTNAAPTVASAASATPKPALGTSTNLTVLGADDGGEPALKYSWTVVGTPPAPVLFGAQHSNAAKATTVRFTRAGSYTLRATIRDAAGAVATSEVVVPVTATASTVTVEPSATGIPTGATVLFAATVRDQFGIPLVPQPPVTWSATGGVINATTGAFTAGTTTGAVAITTSTSGLTPVVAAVNVYSGTNRPPTVATPANATVSSDLVTVALKALGADDAGEAALTYRWLCIAAPAGASVAITPTGPSNAAKNAQTVLSIPGAYRFRCIIADAPGVTISSEVGLQFVGDQPPTFAALPSATMASGSNRDVQLGIQASDDGGEANLTYRWTLVTPAPGEAVFDTVNGSNAGKSLRARVTKAGPYVFEVTATDKNAGQATARATVNVIAVSTALQILPVVTSVVPGGTLDLTTITVDQFGEALTGGGTVVWQPTAGGTIANGRFTAGTTPGDFPLGGSIGAISGQALVSVMGVVPITVDAGSLTGSKVVKSGAVETYYSNKTRILFHLQRPLTDTSTLTLYDNGEKIEELPGGFVSFSRDVSEGEHRLVAVRSGSPAPAGDFGTRLVIDRTAPVVDVEIFPAMTSADRTLINAAGELLLNGNPESGTWDNETIRSRDRIPAFSYSRIVGSTEAESVLLIDPSIVPGSVRVQLVSDTAGAMLPCPLRPASPEDRAEFRWNLPANLPDDDYRIGWTATDLAGNTATELNASIRVRVRRAAPLLQFQNQVKSTVRLGVEGNQLAFLPGLTLKSTALPTTVVPPTRCFTDGTSPVALRPSVRQGSQLGDVPRWTLATPLTTNGQVAVRGQDRYGNYSSPVVFTCIDGYKEQSAIYETFGNWLTGTDATPTHAEIERWSTSEWLNLFGFEWPLVRNFYPYGSDRIRITIDGWVDYDFHNYRRFGFVSPYPMVVDAQVAGQYCDPSRSHFPILTHAGVATTLQNPGWYGHRDQFSKPSNNPGTTILDARRVIHRITNPNNPGEYLPGEWYSYEDSTSSMTFSGYVPPKDTTVPAIRGLTRMTAGNLSAGIPISDYYVLQIPVKPLSDQGAGGQPYVYGRVIDIPPSWSVGSSAHLVEIREPGLAQVITSLVSPLTIKADAYAGPQGAQRIAMSGSTVAAYGAAPNGVAFTIPVARTGSQALTQPGAIDIAYACTGGQPRVTRYGDPELAWKNDGDGWLRSVRIENDVLQYSGHQTLRIKGGFTDRNFTVGSFVPTGEYIRIHQAPVPFDGVPGGMVSVHGAAQLPAERDPKKITIIAYRLIPDPVEPDRLQTLEVDVDVGEQVPRTVLDVDIRCGAIAGSDSDPVARPENGDHFGAIGAVPAGPSHRMRASLMTARFVINPIALWQLEDRNMTIRINDGYDGVSDENCWLDVQLPHLTKADVEQKIKGLTLNWGLEPHVFLLQPGSGTFKKFASIATIPSVTGVRMLGGQVHQTVEEALLGNGESTFYYSISGPLLDSLSLGTLVNAVTVKERRFTIELASEPGGRFPAAPVGSGNLYGNSATVSPSLDQPLLPAIKPTVGLPEASLPYGHNGKFGISPWRSDVTSVALTGWKDDRTFIVSGVQPGTTIFEIKPVFDINGVPATGTSAEVVMEIPVTVEVPVIATPGPYQLHAARLNAAYRRGWTPGGNTSEPTQIDTPVPPADASIESGYWRKPPSYRWLTGLTAQGNIFTTTSLPWTRGETVNTKGIDQQFDLAMHQLAQILPTGTTAGPGAPAGSDTVWHAPASAEGTVFNVPLTDADPNQAMYRLSIERLKTMLLSGEPGPTPDETIRQRLLIDAMPQNLWLRATQIATQETGQARTYAKARWDDFSKEQKTILECKAGSLLDHAALMRLKRYFSLTFDYQTNTTVGLPATTGSDSTGYTCANLPMMGTDAQVSATWWNWTFNGFSSSISTLFDTNISPSWHVGHNYSRDVVMWMIMERECAAGELVGSWQRSGLTHDSSGWPLLLGGTQTSRVPLEVVLVNGNTYTVRVPASYLEAPTFAPYLERGWKKVKGRDLYVLPNSSDLGDAKADGYFLSFATGLMMDLQTGNYTWPITTTVAALAKTRGAAVVARCAYEVDLLNRFLDDAAAEAAEQTMRQGSPISYWAYFVADMMLSVGSIHALAAGYDFKTGQGLRPEDYALHGGMVMLNALPFIGTVAKKLGSSVKTFVGSQANAQARVVKSLSANLQDNPAVSAQARKAADEISDGATPLETAPVAGGRTGTKGLTQASLTSLAGFVEEGVKRNVQEWALMHTGFAQLSRGIAVRAGSQGPDTSAFYSLANATRRELPHPSLARSADIRDVPTLKGRGNDVGKVHQVHAATAGHADEELGRRITSICSKPECFPAGTAVLMADGRSMPIEQIRPGDLVQSRSPADPLGSMTTSRVLRTKLSRAAGLVEVALSVAGRNGMTSLRATADHPVWVVGAGWRGFGSLAPGDQIVGDDATPVLTVEQCRSDDKALLVYNLEVERTHTYFVGTATSPRGPPSGWVWAHNDCDKQILDMAVAAAGKQATLQPSELVRVLDLAKRRLAQNPGQPFIPVSTGIGEGSSSVLRRDMVDAMGFELPESITRAHHLIPIEVTTPYEAFLRKIGFQLDHRSNGVFLPAKEVQAFEAILAQARHAGNHPGYSKAMKEVMERMKTKYADKLDDLEKQGKSGSREWWQTVDEARQKMLEVQSRCRDLLLKGERIVASSSPTPTNQTVLEDRWMSLLADLPAP